MRSDSKGAGFIALLCYFKGSDVETISDDP